IVDEAVDAHRSRRGEVGCTCEVRRTLKVVHGSTSIPCAGIVGVEVSVAIAVVVGVGKSALQLNSGRRRVRIISVHGAIAVIHGTDKNFGSALFAAATLLLLTIGISTRIATWTASICLTLILTLTLIFFEEALLLARLVFIPGSIALGRGALGTIGLAIRGRLSLICALTGIASRSTALAATTKTLLLPRGVLAGGGGIPLRRRRRTLRLRR